MTDLIKRAPALRLSTSGTTALAATLIRTDGGTQPRAGIDPVHVERLRGQAGFLAMSATTVEEG